VKFLVFDLVWFYRCEVSHNGSVVEGMNVLLRWIFQNVTGDS